MHNVTSFPLLRVTDPNYFYNNFPHTKYNIYTVLQIFRFVHEYINLTKHNKVVFLHQEQALLNI